MHKISFFYFTPTGELQLKIWHFYCEKFLFFIAARLTFDVNSIALLFAERILDCPKLIQKLIVIEKEGKDYVLKQLREYDYWCKDCKGNFIFVKPKHNAKEIAKSLEMEKKVLVHSYNNEILKDYIRVSVGSKNAMQIFLEAFLEIDKE